MSGVAFSIVLFFFRVLGLDGVKEEAAATWNKDSWVLRKSLHKRDMTASVCTYMFGLFNRTYIHLYFILAFYFNQTHI